MKKIKDLFRIVEKTDFQEVEVVEGEFRIRIERNKGPEMQPMASSLVQPQMATCAAVNEQHSLGEKHVEAAAEKGNVISSPFVGTFYSSPSPDSEAYTEVGALVKEGQVLCIVEAMKLMNEIESEFKGVIKEILVKNGQPVEFGQALFRIE